ncbi:MAG: hypothetical protein WD426_03130 [Anditalea sp.]
MKRISVFIGILMMFGAFGCTNGTCRCEGQFTGGVKEGIKLGIGEECSDLEPMLGKCTEE